MDKHAPQPSRLEALLQEGVRSLDRNEYEEASFYFEEVVSQDPDNPAAARYLRALSASGHAPRRAATADLPSDEARLHNPSLEAKMPPPPRSSEYQVLEKVAQGGLCELYLGRETIGPSPGRRCVLKLLRACYTSDPNLRGAMRNEGEILRLLRHPNIVRAFGLVRIGDREGLALEVLEGVTVDTLCGRIAGRPTLQESLAIMIPVFEALEYVHRLSDSTGRPLGIVHRDISPGNVFLTADGRVKLLDFGISRWARGGCKTKKGVLKGTPSFMSPEQATGRPVDFRTDLFSAGLVLLSLLTGGGSPFNRGALAPTLIAVSEGLRPPVAELLPSGPPALIELLEALLEQEPRSRPSDAGSVARALGLIAGGLGGPVRRADLVQIVHRGVAGPKGPGTTVDGRAAPREPDGMEESESLARLFESIQGRLIDLTPTARNLGASSDVSAPPASGASEDERASEGLVGKVAVELEAAAADPEPLADDEAETVILTEARPASRVSSVEVGQPADIETGTQAETSGTPKWRRRWGGILVVAVALTFGFLFSTAKDGRGRRVPPEPPSQAASTASSLSEAEVESAASRAPASEAATSEPKPRPPSQVRRNLDGDKRRGRSRRPPDSTSARGLGSLVVRCPAPWQLQIVGGLRRASSEGSRIELPVGHYRLVVFDGSREFSATAHVVSRSPAVVECPWRAE